MAGETCAERSLACAAVTKIGASETGLFLRILAEEMGRYCENRKFPLSVLKTLRCFIDKHYTTLIHLLPQVIDIALKAIDIREPSKRRMCIEKAGKVI
jgi:hypothetical protein